MAGGKHLCTKRHAGFDLHQDIHIIIFPITIRVIEGLFFLKFFSIGTCEFTKECWESNLLETRKLNRWQSKSSRRKIALARNLLGDLRKVGYQRFKNRPALNANNSMNTHTYICQLFCYNVVLWLWEICN